MKKIYFVLTFSVFLLFNVTNNIKAQEKCHYTIDKDDPFSGKHILAIRTPIKNLAMLGYDWQLFLYKIGVDFHIETSIIVTGTQNDFLEKGDSIMFKFESGKVVTCYAQERITPKAIAGSTGYLNVFYPITEDNFKTFTTSIVTYVQMNCGAKAYAEKMPEKNAKKIVNSAVCIMK